MFEFFGYFVKMKALLCVLVISCGAAVLADVSSIEILEQLLLNSDKTLPREDGPTNVEIGLYVNDMSIDNEEGLLYLNGYIRQSWQDPRLMFNESSTNKIIVPDDYLESFWCPDIFFRNARDLKVFYKPVPNFLMTINATGHVWYVYKAGVELACPKLKKSGNAYCGILFESFKYTTDQMQLSWLPTPIDVAPDIYLNDYTIEDKIVYNCTQTYSSGSYPCMEARFDLQRDCIIC